MGRERRTQAVVERDVGKGGIVVTEGNGNDTGSADGFGSRQDGQG